MKSVGLIVAMEIEAVLERFGVPVKEEHYGDFHVRTYQCDGYILYVINCVVGEIAAASETQLLISLYHVDLIVNYGVVGALTEEIGLAQNCIIERVVHYDMDTSAVDNCEVGRYLEYPDIYIPVNREVFEKAREICPEITPVTCCSADKFVGDPEKKRALAAMYHADICEMESAGILLTANRNHVPALFIKSISDSVNGGAEEFTREVMTTSRVCLEVTDRIIRELI